MYTYYLLFVLILKIVYFLASNLFHRLYSAIKELLLLSFS